MANTFIAIGSVTVGSGGAASIDFTSIPQTYTDLCLKISARAGGNNLLLQFNGSAANYNDRYLIGSGTVASSNSNTSTTKFWGLTDTSTQTTNTFASNEYYISNYTSSNYKSTSLDTVQEDNTANAYSYLYAGLWSSTAAITSISATPSSGTFAQYSTATLYGIKNS